MSQSDKNGVEVEAKSANDNTRSADILSERDPCNNTIGWSNDCNNVAYNNATDPASKLHITLSTLQPHYLDQHDFYKVYEYFTPEKPALKERLYKVCSCSARRIFKLIQKRLPIVSWLPAYNIRNNLLSDIVAGITLAIIQIPQAMAFTMLSSASPVLGLYATFISTAIYFFLGTSKFSSLGMAGTTALVVGQAINTRLQELQVVDEVDNNGSVSILDVNGFQLDNVTIPRVIDIDKVKLEVVTTMAFTVGVLQTTMGLLNLGCISIFFSDVMMRGCTMAAVLQMIIGQFPYLLGISIHRRGGPFSSLYNLIEICKTVPLTNVATLTISMVCAAFLLVVNEGINAKYKHKMKIPVPTEIILIMVSTMVSYYAQLDKVYEVRTLHHIPTGLPNPTPPQIVLIPHLLVDSVIVTILTFTIIMSQAKVLSSKYACTPDISQELFANGVANVIGSFFSSMPCSFAFVRCMLLIQLGAKSMLTSIICATTLLLVLLFIAPIFQPLPHSVLAVIIVVALAEILLDLKLVKTTWKSVKTDSILIVTSFVAVFLLDLQYGIAVGVVTSMAMVIFKSITSKIVVMGHVPGTEIYLEIQKFKKAVEIDQIKIFNINGPLFFGNRDKLKKKIDKKVIRPFNENRVRDVSLNIRQKAFSTTPTKLGPKMRSFKVIDVEGVSSKHVVAVILDFSSVTFLDTAALRMLYTIKEDLNKIKVKMYIAAPKVDVLKAIERSEEQAKLTESVFPCVHEAVIAVRVQKSTRLHQTEYISHACDNPTFVQHL